MEFGFVLSKLFILFFAMAAGFILTKCGALKENAGAILSKVVLYVFNPAMVLASAMSNSHAISNLQVLELSIIACLCYAFLIVVAKLVTKLLGLPKPGRKLYQFMFIFSNIGFFGMPMVNALFGSDAVFLVSMYMLPFQCLTFTYGVTLVARDGTHQKFSWKMLLHPMIISTLLAYVIYLTGVKTPEFITETVDFLGKAASPLAMIVVGSTLAAASLKQVFGNWRLYVLLAVKMVVVPIIVLYALRFNFADTESNRLIIAVSTTVMAMPTAANTTILATQYGGDVETASCGVFLATVFSAVTVPFLMMLL